MTNASAGCGNSISPAPKWRSATSNQVVFQIQIAKRVDSLPLTRDYMYGTRATPKRRPSPLRVKAVAPLSETFAIEAVDAADAGRDALELGIVDAARRAAIFMLVEMDHLMRHRRHQQIGGIDRADRNADLVQIRDCS